MGTVSGCMSFDGEVSYRNNKGTSYIPGCRHTPNLNPVRQSIIHGKKICGTQAGKAFVDVTRPDAGTFMCPAGTAPCSPRTSPENTVCYPDGQINPDCPITEVFMANSEVYETIKSDSAYRVLDFI